MIVPSDQPSSRRIAANADDVVSSTLLGICASLKPAAGQNARSAVRGLLAHGLEVVAKVYPEVCLLDLRDHPLPHFDGRRPEALNDPAAALALSCVSRSGALLLAVPAYWSGVSGVFKNFVDVLCGPVYDLDAGARTVFAGKPVGLLIVGADETSALLGAEQAVQVMTSTGSRVVGKPVVVGDPRSQSGENATARIAAELIALTAELARHSAVAGAPR